MSDRVITNVFQGNSASGSNIRQYESADVDVTAVANANQSHGYPWYHHPGTNANTDVTTTVAQSNAASGNNITQVANADVDVTAVANANGHGFHYPWYPAHGGNASTDVNTYVGQSNQASGNGITQVSNADVDVTAIANNYGHLSYGPYHTGAANTDVATTVVQQNAASGNGIYQSTNADVDITAVTTASGGHGWHYPWYPAHGGNASTDVNTYVGQSNQASGNGITQVSNADVDITAIANNYGHLGYGAGGGTAGSDIQTVVAQQNAASGNGIFQSTNADVDVLASTTAYDHGHGWWFPHAPHAGAENDVATTVVQANQAVGNGIYQHTGADVDVTSFVSAF